MADHHQFIIYMEFIFQLNEVDRAAFLQHISQSFGCTFVCLWYYVPQHPNSNCLLYLDGIYHEENTKQAAAMASSSSGNTLSQRLFDDYRMSVFILQNCRVPGHAFKNNLPYMELKQLELQAKASNQTQLHFYQEARIKTAIFMGCKLGEIELGISTDSQVNLEVEMRNFFPEYISRLQAVPRELPQPARIHDPNLTSSSPSSLRSLSIDSHEGSPFVYNIASTSYNIQQPLPTLAPTMTTTTRSTYNPFQEALQNLGQIRNIRFPTMESEDAAITRAILAVISNPSPPPPASPSSSTSSHHPQQRPSAFRTYARSNPASQMAIASRVQKQQNMLRRAIGFIRCSSLMRAQEQMQAGNNAQLQHMIKERRRREKLNESFQALRSLLPPGSKKDKVSVLSNTMEYMNSLKNEIEELTRRNQMIEEQLQMINQTTLTTDPPPQEMVTSTSDHQRLQIRITNVVETTSDARMLDLRVNVRGECSIVDIGIRVLEFLKQLSNVTLISVEANTRIVETTSVTHLLWRLKIDQGEEWDEATFQEAVRRVITDVAQ